MIRHQLPDMCKLARLCGTSNKHQVFSCAPATHCCKHFFINVNAIGGEQLKIVSTLVRGESKHDGPFVSILQERPDAVFSHIRRNSYRIKFVNLEECFCI